MQSIPNFILLAILFFLLIWQVKFAKNETFHKDGFSLEACKAMQGFLSLLIIVHHVYTFLEIRDYDVTVLHWSANIGVYLIGFFFFCSGYGLIVSLHTKENYLQGFMVKRVLIVLVPFFICNYAYMFVELLLVNRYPMHELIAAFFGIVLLNSQMWFAVEIMLLYLVFFVLFKHIKNEKIGIIIMTALIMIVTLLAMMWFKGEKPTKWFSGEWWYNTTPLFIIGMIVARHREQIKSFIAKYYWLAIGVCILGVCITGMQVEETLYYYGYWTFQLSDKLISYVVQVPHVIFFELFLILVMQKIQFRNLCLDVLGKFSLEILLVNGVFLNGFLGVLECYGLTCYLCLTFVGTLFSAVLLYKLKRFILEIR